MEVALQCGLRTGTKVYVYVDNIFAFLDLLEHMGDKGYGVTGPQAEQEHWNRNK